MDCVRTVSESAGTVPSADEGIGKAKTDSGRTSNETMIDEERIVEGEVPKESLRWKRNENLYKSERVRRSYILTNFGSCKNLKSKHLSSRHPSLLNTGRKREL